MSIYTTAIGNLGKAPEAKKLDNGELIVFSLATRGRKGETTWVNCKAFGKTGELIQKHFGAGSKIVVNGTLELRKYTTKDGAEGESLDMFVNGFSFAGGKKEESSDEEWND